MVAILLSGKGPGNEKLQTPDVLNRSYSGISPL